MFVSCLSSLVFVFVFVFVSGVSKIVSKILAHLRISNRSCIAVPQGNPLQLQCQVRTSSRECHKYPNLYVFSMNF